MGPNEWRLNVIPSHVFLGIWNLFLRRERIYAVEWSLAFRSYPRSWWEVKKTYPFSTLITKVNTRWHRWKRRHVFRRNGFPLLRLNWCWYWLSKTSISDSKCADGLQVNYFYPFIFSCFWSYERLVPCSVYAGRFFMIYLPLNSIFRLKRFIRTETRQHTWGRSFLPIVRATHVKLFAIV